MTCLAELDLAAAASQAAGNWQRWESFVWYRASELEQPDDWAIFYTHHRDSGLLAQSNAAALRKALRPFIHAAKPDVVLETHTHWAVGHAEGFSLRVFHRRRITSAFRTYHELLSQLDDYPVLDEDDYSQREFEATLANLEFAADRLQREFRLPGDWPGQVYSWLSDFRPTALESHDDQGGWPEPEDLAAAFQELGYRRKAF